ncbi:hypothetical protein BJ138DRAFT_1168745 [Hygrophoropsis aurantiaca]|uniref:Uncharacterized protein n=1 Tax=Hygrophoropsis aurantiaca TaxID=72124 RepID=A0ACB7ZP14_9AGAM|nr:hypothetical protein BJ138DRAFT_1168745 [Hygrophoropsis aurantiaca]
MPRDLYLTTGNFKHSLSLCRPISSSDWAIFQKYSPRVRSVPISHHKIDTPLFHELCSPSAPSPLLPNLRSLRWITRTDDDVLFLQRLVSPSLTSLDLMLFNPENLPSLDPDCKSPFETTCASLRILILASLVFPAKLGERLPRMRRLESITWKYIFDSKAIIPLAQLPALTYAEFNIPSDFSYQGLLFSDSETCILQSAQPSHHRRESYLCHGFFELLHF